MATYIDSIYNYIITMYIVIYRIDRRFLSLNMQKKHKVYKQRAALVRQRHRSLAPPPLRCENRQAKRHAWPAARTLPAAFWTTSQTVTLLLEVEPNRIRYSARARRRRQERSAAIQLQRLCSNVP